VDDSEAAEAVADTARWLAHSLGARLVLLHVAEGSERTPEEEVSAVRVRLGRGERDEVHFLEGAAATRLMELADEDGAELLVVGSRGRGSIRSAMLGSVSRTLAASASSPVVIVPPAARRPDRAEGGDGREPSIVCGVDGSKHAVAAARLAGELAGGLGLRLVVVHALPDAKSVASYPGGRSTAPALSGQPDSRTRLADEIVDDAIEAVDGEATGVVEPGRPWDVLEAVADREAGRLLAVAARGHGGLRAAVFGSVASQLATSSSRPVLVLPEQAESRVRAG
jgi:nucleotide-binding universal stress UspA family protein